MAAEKKKAATAAEMMGVFQKTFGEKNLSIGGELDPAKDRLPTGLFELDLALGGGFPRGRCTTIFGAESSSKTNIVLLAIANHQRMFPALVCVFFDIEHAFDPNWAKLLGVDVDKLIVVRPSFGEQVVDMAEGFLHTEDIGVVAIDSLAAMMSTKEIENEAGKATPGASGNLVSKLARKTILAMSEAEKQGRYPTLFYINQIRYKIGIVYGNPETMPGGDWPRFQSSIWLKVHGKNVIDPKVHAIMPSVKEVAFVVKKWKCPILSHVVMLLLL
jgi:recombination protein RecA